MENEPSTSVPETAVADSPPPQVLPPQQAQPTLFSRLLSKLQRNKRLAALVFVIAFGLIGGLAVYFGFAQSGTTTQQMIEGQVIEFIAEDFKGNDAASKTEYYLKTQDGKRVKLQPSEGAKSKLQGGSKVRITSTVTSRNLFDPARAAAASSTLAVSDASSVTVLSTAATTAVANYKTALILVNTTDNPAQPFSADHAKQRAFTDNDSIAAYYRENSYGKFNLVGKSGSVGDVYGWFTVPKPADSDNISCSQTFVSEVTAQAAGQGIDLSGYDRILWALPDCGSIAEFNGVNAYTSVSDYGNPGDLAHAEHEFGHTLGLGHAHKLNCLDAYGFYTSLSSSCTTWEYGDMLDIMGNGTGHLNGRSKQALGWLDATNVQQVSSSGDYTLSSFEQPSTSLQVLRVLVSKRLGTYYTLEFRQNYGFDQGVNGIVVRRDAPGVYPPTTDMVVPLPYVYTPDGKVVRPGTTFVDRTNGLNITLVSVTGNTAVVRVKYGKIAASQDSGACTITAPKVVTAGSAIAFDAALTLTNTSKVAWEPASYSVNYILTDDWGISPTHLALPRSVQPGQSITIAQHFTANSTYSNAATRDFSWRLTNEANNEFFSVPCRTSVNLKSSTNSDTTPPAAITDLKASLSNGVVSLSWTTSPDVGSGGGYKLFRKGGYAPDFMIYAYPLSFVQSFDDKQLSPGTTYSYYLTAYDSNGNESGSSNIVTVTTAR